MCWKVISFMVVAFASLASLVVADVDEVIAQAEELVDAGKPQEAEALIRSAIKDLDARIMNTSDDPELHYERSVLRYQLKDYGAAFQDCDRAINLKEGEAKYHYHRARIYFEQKRFPEATADFEAAQSLSGNDVNYMVNFARSLLFMGRKEDGIAKLRETVKLHPESREALVELLETLRVERRFDDAAKDLQSAIERQPKDVDLHYALGQVYRELNRLEDAYSVFGIARRIEPTFFPAETKLLLVANALGKKEAAAEHLKNVYRLQAEGHVKMPFFGREEFQVGKCRVAVSEYFALKGPTPAKYEAFVSCPDAESFDVYRLGTDQVVSERARIGGFIDEGESMYYLYGMLEPNARMEYYAYFPKEIPEYETVRAMVVEIIEGKRKPLTEFRVEAQSKVEEEIDGGKE